jgi:predicted RNA binding protein with dsRBD fold (UPF0201 family)
MKIPNIACHIEMSSQINSSEDPSSIKKAISNIFPYSIMKNENFEIIAKSKELKSFEKVYETIHTNHSQKVYSRNLENNLKDDTTWFLLNKQAAFVEKIVICEDAGESPLGPILVTLTSSSIDDVIDWISFGN